MPNSSISSKYAFLGDNLELKKNVSLEIDKDGKFSNISYDEPEENIVLDNTTKSFLMIPGLINSHIHIGDSFAKELGFNKELSEIVSHPYGLKHKLLRQISEDIKQKGIQNAALEMLSNGITFFVDFREEGAHGVKLLRDALEQSPINFLALGRFMDESEIDPVFENADGIGFASYEQLTDTNRKWVTAAKEKTGKIIACHTAEKSRDVNSINSLLNDSLIDIIVHGTKLIKSDLEKIKKNHKSLILCPRCNGYFGLGFPPIIDILKLEIPISLGTDNLMLNNTDLFEEIRYLYRITRILGSYDKQIQLTSKELLKMVTINAAKNFKIDSEYGTIAEGKSADFFLIDLNDPNLYSNKYDNIFDIITQRTKSENIKKSYIRGKLVFDRKA